AGYLNCCLDIRWAFEPQFGRDVLSAKSWRRHNDARDRLTGLAARAGIELAMESLASAASKQETAPAMGVLTRSANELSGRGELAEHLAKVFRQEITNHDWRRLAAAATVVKTVIPRLSGHEADELISLLNGAVQPSPAAKGGEAYRSFLAEVSECRSLRASLPKRFQSIETGGSDGASEATPWDEYELQEIPITNVPADYAGGRWDNIILSGDQLILIWLKGRRCYVSSVPVTGGQLRLRGMFAASDPTETDMMQPIHWAAVLNDTLYVARSWAGDEATAYQRVLKGEQPVPSDWPGLLVIKDGKVVKGYSEDDGLPGRSINTMAALDGKLYFGIDYRELSVTDMKGKEGWMSSFIGPGPGALASFDPATESFELVASSRRLTPRNALDGGGPWGVTDILPDPKRDGLWLRICETTPNHSAPGTTDRSGVWKYEPKGERLEMLNDFPGQMGWFDEGRLSDIGLHILDVDGGGIGTFGPDRPFDRIFTLPNGKPYGPIGKGLEWPVGEGQVRYFRLGEYVLDGLVLCDPQTDRAYPLPRGRFGLTSDFSFRLPNDGGVLVADKTEFRIYRIARKTGNAAPAGKSAAGELASWPPPMPPTRQAPPAPKACLVLWAGRYHILNTDTGDLSTTGWGQYHGATPRRAFAGGPAPVGLKPDSFCGSPCCERQLGLIDQSGQVVVPYTHREILQFREGLAAATAGKDGQRGFVNRQGQWAIPPRFDGVQHFSEGRAAVNVGSTKRWFYPDEPLYGGGKWGFCDRKGKIVAPMVYAAAQAYSQGLAAVFRSPYGWGYIDLHGRTAIPHQYGTARPFRDGAAWVSREDQLHYGIEPGVRNEADEMTTHTGFNMLFYRQIRVPSFGGHWQLIDRTGRALTKGVDGLVTDFCEGRAWFRPEGEGWGCLDPSGAVAIQTRYESPLPFSEGLARAGVGAPTARFGFLDRQGRWAVKPSFTAADSFSEGLAAVCVGGHLTSGRDDYNVAHQPVGGRWGYINRRGEWVSNPPAKSSSTPGRYGPRQDASC
ncbi:MAG: WG repeat-containing protein, partial [Planctomycetota bacterium]